MVKQSYALEFDQFDPKVFKESLGSFGTTTQPGANQLTELQTKVRQGVKHVELHLASSGKGGFGQQDVPDKYGFEQRRTIMQLAKLNEQTLSVHGTFEVTSFSGLAQGGFNEVQRATQIKEIDETIKFAAETAKGGAVVFHIQGDATSSTRSDLNLSKSYLDWLKENKSDEYERIKRDYLDANPLKRQFVDNPDYEKEVRAEYNELSPDKKAEFERKASQDPTRNAWEFYYMKKASDKAKLNPNFSPYIVVGDKIDQVQRAAEMVDLDVLKGNTNVLDENDINALKLMGVKIGDVGIDDFQRAQAIFTNGLPNEYKNQISEDHYERLKKKVTLNYDKFLENNMNLQSMADKEFHQKLMDTQIQLAKLQKEDLDVHYDLNKDELLKIKALEVEEQQLLKDLKRAQAVGDNNTIQEIKRKLNGAEPNQELVERFNELVAKLQDPGVPNEQKKNIEKEALELRDRIQMESSSSIRAKKTELQYKIGVNEYPKFAQYHEQVSQINEKIRQLEEQKENVKSLTDEIFDKNTSAMGHLGIKALRYQLDLKEKAKVAQDKVKEINSEVLRLEKEYENASSADKNNLHVQILKKKYELRKWIGVKDYDDIDLINRPLYLAPENMLPGYGSLTSVEEFKGTVRMSWEQFAKKILSDEGDYKKLREDYEKSTGIKVDSHDKALEVAKRHIGGTFDNAHAAVWLKHFKREAGESEEHRIERFNKWLNQQAEDMVREGIVKHAHFNDTQGKDDDHNLLGQGILDLHDMRERMRKAGLKEPLIVEAGGRGAHSNMHLMNALDIFNPTITSPGAPPARGYSAGTSVSDWVSVQRDYLNRPQYSPYGMSYSSFKHQMPQQGPKGDWSGTNFF